MRRLTLLAIFAVLLSTAASAHAATLSKKTPPISRQNCAQLEKTSFGILGLVGKHFDLKTGALHLSGSTLRHINQETRTFDRRVKQLGGCPQYPGLALPTTRG